MPHGKIIAYDSNTFSRNQQLEKNAELRGGRQSGSRVPGPRNPGGALNGHMTDVTIPLMWFGALGVITSTVKIAPAVTAALVTIAGSIDNGTHSYKLQITRPGGIMTVTAKSNVVTTDGTHGKVNVTLPVLPAGWTKALFRSAVGDAGPWLGIPGATALAAATTVFLDNIPDASLTGAPAASTNDDWQHVITPWNGDGNDVLPFPSFLVQRKLPYVADAAAYFHSPGSQVNKASVAMKSTGFYDIGADFLVKSYAAAVANYDVAPLNWRGGEKLHHAMLTASKTLIDGAAYGKLLDFKVDVMNNLATDDLPMGLQGDRGSSVPLQQEINVAATLKVTDPSVLALAQDGLFHTSSFQWDFATPNHFHKMDIFGIQFDPSDPTIQGQGILKMATNAMASQPVGGNQMVVTIVNDQPPSAYIGAV
jgi:hypothetical protein